MSERRRAGRLNVRLVMVIAGVDSAPVTRRCNLSTTGLYFEIDQEVGAPGSVQKLHLQTLDGTHSVDVMARVVRVIINNDIWRGSTVAGMAADFMLPSADARARIEAFMMYLLHHMETRTPELVPASSRSTVQWTFGAQVQDATRDAASEPTTPAMVHALDGQGMLLDTTWPAQVGEKLRCEIEAPVSKRRMTLEGEVVQTASAEDATGKALYHLQVRFLAPTAMLPHPPSPGLSIADAIDALLEEAVLQPPEGGFPLPNEHLAGLLSRIRLPSLLAFFEVEKLEGELSVASDNGRAVLHVQAGQVIDVSDSTVKGDALATVRALLAWSDGKFEFRAVPVQRPNRINLSTTHLLLKLSHEADEAQR